MRFSHTLAGIFCPSSIATFSSLERFTAEFGHDECGQTTEYLWKLEEQELLVLETLHSWSALLLWQTGRLVDEEISVSYFKFDSGPIPLAIGTTVDGAT